MTFNDAVDRTMGTVEFVVDRVDARVGPILEHAEQEVGYRPAKVAAWGLATASVLGAVAAGFGAVAAMAGAYLAVRAAMRARQGVPEQMEPLWEPVVQEAAAAPREASEVAAAPTVGDPAEAPPEG